MINEQQLNPDVYYFFVAKACRVNKILMENYHLSNFNVFLPIL
jgi:hypothetical protein